MIEEGFAMKNYEEIVGEAIRIEVEENTGKMFVVFEITSEYQKRYIKKNWYKDIEYRILDKKLIVNYD